MQIINEKYTRLLKTKHKQKCDHENVQTKKKLIQVQNDGYEHIEII